ncbi:MAG: GtrA family protein [Pseudomonadota bacterium]
MTRLFALLDRLLALLPLPARFARFCVVGTSGAFVGFVSLDLLVRLFPSTWGVWEHRAAFAGSIAIAIFSNFLLNYHWTWGDRARATGALSWLAKLGRFYLVSALAASVQWIVAVELFERLHMEALMGPWGKFVAQAAGIVTAMFINFFANHLWTFKRTRG